MVGEWAGTRTARSWPARLAPSLSRKGRSLKRLAPILLTPVALLLLGAALTPGDGSRPMAPGESSPPDTITTELHPGWNMAAWLGPDASVSELFDAIPALRRVSAWDPEHEGYERASRTGTLSPSLTHLTRGRGLWLYVGGTATVEWTRPVSRDGTLLSLPSGLNLAGWTGRDGIAVEEAFARFGETLSWAARWNEQTQDYEWYIPRAATHLNTLAELRLGDAVWIEVSGDARWWQSGAARTRFVLTDGVPAELEAEVRAETAAVVTFFAERFAALPPEFTVVVEPTATTYTTSYRLAVALNYRTETAPIGSLIAREYFRLLQTSISPRANPYFPGPDGVHPQGADWLKDGAELYAQYAYLKSVDPETARLVRDRQISVASWAGESLREIESQTRTHYEHHLLQAWSSRGFFAAEWLAERVGAPALLDYYRVVDSARNWREAFEQAFGISLDRFYEAAEPYLSETAPPMPHLADDRAEPILVLLGDIPPEEAAAVREQFETAQEFFRERLGADPADYTVYVAADDESAAPAFRKAFATDPDPRFCFTAMQGSALVMTLDCRWSLADHLGSYHYINIHEPIVVATGFPSHGPRWLRLGLSGYAEYTYLAAAGPETIETVRSRLARTARRVELPLSSLETYTSGTTPRVEVLTPLSYFAVEWLAQRAGEKAILEYLRQRSSSEPWQDTFEPVFGISVDDFYEEFEAYRAEVAPLAR